LGLLLLAACGGGPQPAAPAAPGARAATPAARATAHAGFEALETSRYAEAERLFRAVLSAAPAESTERRRALVGWAKTLLITGRRAELAELLEREGAANAPERLELLTVRAELHRQQGRLDAALATLAGAPPAGDGPSSRERLELWLLQAEILLEQGRRAEARGPLGEIIDAYNQGLPDPADAPCLQGREGAAGPQRSARCLAIVGRAAHLLRSPHDANDAFDEAEAAGPVETETLLWRAELFLDKDDFAHASEVLDEVLKRAPKHPGALVARAHVRLGQALDFDEAERLARAALDTHPEYAPAYFVLGAIALRDEDVAQAEAHVARGLQKNPRHLDLLALSAAARFLADDRPGFDAAVERVLALNPEFTRMFSIIGEFADWEHRYDDIIQMMRRATRIDPEDGRARAQLGLNLLRAGQDAAGVVELRRAFESDPFNVRVYNTLELYEKIIPRDYVEVRSGRFSIRYPKAERALLERYVPDLLDRAYRKMAAHYGFEPEGPIGVELYAKREQFAVRTSGLPQTGIQGVCFGRTLATMSLAEEPANLGMTLWHELAHVFHIQLSRSRVPRWFTEGLAELETARERPEWSRELDPQLYQALRSERLPPVAQLSRAFTRAEHMEDVATAYFASSQIATFLADRHGMDKVAGMLRAWGAGKPATEVLSGVLGATPVQIDDAFRAQLRRDLARYQVQFLPRKWRGSFLARKEAAEKRPSDLDAQLAYALALLELGRLEDAEKRTRAVLDRKPDHADAQFALARMELARGAWESAAQRLEAFIGRGNDGYEPRLLLAEIALGQDDRPRAIAQFTAAHRFDRRASEPLARLAELHQQAGDDEAELAALRQLAPLEEHAGPVHRRLLELLTQRGLWQEAAAAGEAALWTQLNDLRIHSLFARALERTGDSKRALYELESAALCPGSPAERALAHRELSGAYERAGRRKEARAAAAEAERLESAPAPSASSGH
jgi:tetratricopeptide (TPR) repeat protein